MSRDMQIGLLLAVGFIALVGGVLYYRIEHPDELENYLGGSPQAQASAPLPTHPDVGNALAGNTDNSRLPTAPTATAPTLDNTITFNDNQKTTPSTGNNNPVTLASGSATGETAKPIPTSAGGTTPPTMSPPAFPMVALNDKKPLETKPEPAKTETATRSSFPTETPGNTTSPTITPPATTAPAISLNVDGNTKPPETAKKEEKKTEEKKPLDLIAKTDTTPTAPPITGAPMMPLPPVTTNNTSTAMNDSGKAKEVEKKSDEMPQPPVLTGSAPSLGGGLNLNVNSPVPAAPTGNSSPPSLGGTSTPPSQSSPPSLSSPPSFNTTPPLKDSTPPLSTTPSTSSPLTGTSPSSSPASPLLGNSAPQTTPPSVPETVIKPNNLGNTNPPASTTERGPVDGDNMRVYPVRAGLGKPLTETEAQNRERRWAETAGSPSPIVPSSATSFNPSGSGVSAPASTASDRRITRDTVIPWEYAVRGETFSSLSQRLYGDTSYAAALAEFNKEHDFVTLDQPQPNQVIAKPNREILEQRYPQLIPRMKASTYTPSSTAVNNMQRGNTTTAAPAESFKTYRVAKGEQLFEVAKKTLGDGYRWSEIYALNKDQLRDSTELRPDMVLKIPSTGGK